jgi:hypothetical protein
MQPATGAEDLLQFTAPGLAEGGKNYLDRDLLMRGGQEQMRAVDYYYFVSGVVSALFYERRLCSAPDVNSTQTATMVAKYLNEHPERWQLSPVQLIHEALEPTFPCPRKAK